MLETTAAREPAVACATGPGPTVEDDFDRLIRRIKAAALDGTTTDFMRAAKFIEHLGTVRDRWTAGDASPVRTAKVASAAQ